MRLKDAFITHDSEGEQVLIDVTSSFAGLVRSNKTAAFIVDCLKTDTTKEQIVDAMYEKYDAPKEVLQKDVDAIIDKLRGIGALEE
jgi:methyltransferase-like protein